MLYPNLFISNSYCDGAGSVIHDAWHVSAPAIVDEHAPLVEVVSEYECSIPPAENKKTVI
jgi:hypothetical protein